jgi:CheY-like chemotaxis protein
MFFQEWNVLVVDDEPDVLAVTKLALIDAEVYGLPIKIHTAKSKAEAMDLLNTTFAIKDVPEGSLTVGLIDVVMESQHAGLELCEYIRASLKNQSAQLYIRTGQPGVMPERIVIDRYDISGYFTKVEMTEQKLYTFVKSGIRQWLTSYYSKLVAELTNRAIQHAETKAQLLKMLTPIGKEFGLLMIQGIVFEQDTVLTYVTPEQVLALHDELVMLPPMIETSEGHRFIADGKRVMTHIAETPSTADYYFVAEYTMAMPPHLYDVTFKNGLALSMLWKRAQ